MNYVCLPQHSSLGDAVCPRRFVVHIRLLKIHIWQSHSLHVGVEPALGASSVSCSSEGMTDPDGAKREGPRRLDLRADGVPKGDSGTSLCEAGSPDNCGPDRVPEARCDAASEPRTATDSLCSEPILPAAAADGPDSSEICCSVSDSAAPKG